MELTVQNLIRMYATLTHDYGNIHKNWEVNAELYILEGDTYSKLRNIVLHGGTYLLTTDEGYSVEYDLTDYVIIRVAMSTVDSDGADLKYYDNYNVNIRKD